MQHDDDFETLAPGTSGGGASTKSGPSLKARAIGFLSRREHSRLELERKLTPHAGDAQELAAVLDDLERENWLSNERFAQSLVHRRSAGRGAGRILQELKQHGLEADTIEHLSGELRGTEASRAQAVWAKKFGQAPLNGKDYARQFRFLASRGFSSEIVRRILGDIPYGSD